MLHKKLQEEESMCWIQALLSVWLLIVSCTSLSPPVLSSVKIRGF